MRQQINDGRFEALDTQGYLGSIGDMTAAWLKVAGASGNSIDDLWNSRFDLAAIPAGARPDREVAFYLSEGATGGHIDDLELSFWQAQLP